MPRKNHNKKEIQGTIRIHPRGFGFLIPDNRAQNPTDIFIPKRATLGAVDGDKVKVAVSPYISDKGPEGYVVKILQRGRSTCAGMVSYVGKKNQIFAFIPILGEEKTMRIVPSQERELQEGDRILIHVLDWGTKNREALGEMSAYIGPITNASYDTLAALYEYEIRNTFPEEVLEEAKSFGTSVTAKEIAQREDLRDLVCFTIDPATAKDFDDALSLSQDDNGNYHLGIHIADVSHYVSAGSALDKEALARCNSVYFPGEVVPMLPHELSSHLCSLKPQVNRLAISVLVTLDNGGNVLRHHICKSVIKSKKRFSYEEAKEVLDGAKQSKYLPDLKLMVELCYLLKKKRAERGSIEFSLPDLSFELSSTGEIKQFNLVEYDITHQLVEEFMLLANALVATKMSQEGKPLTYRIHEEPNPENIKEFASIASLLGFQLDDAPTSEELQAVFDEARSSPFGQFLATAFIKSMKLAAYSTENIGHYGLGLPHYTHFTSPIRRYIDLLVHRVLFDEVDEDTNLEEIAQKCSDKERLSAKAESSVVSLKKLRYLLERQNKGLDTYSGVVVAVKQFGTLFELKELLFEGFLPIVDRRLVLGTEVKVQLRSVDLIFRGTEWDLLSLPKRERSYSKKHPSKRRKR